MNPEDQLLQFVTRRHFFSRCSIGVGGIALASLLGDRTLSAATAKQPHFPPKIKNVIYLFMAGGPSQLELFDYKPKLIELSGKTPPKSMMDGRRFAFLKGT